SIVPASSHTLYKKQCSNRAEGTAYEAISKDPKLVCIGFTPRFYKQIEKNEESFIEIEDLLAQFADPSHTGIMDIKVGTRTFLESEVSNAKLRADLGTQKEKYHKTPVHAIPASVRAARPSSAFGLKRQRCRVAVCRRISKSSLFRRYRGNVASFFGPDLRRVRNAILGRLIKMRDAVENSDFFATHEVVGSSLLLMYDQDKVGVWAIDFAKSTKIEPGRVLTHRKTWTPGNNEDGYLMGLDNLIQIVEDIHVGMGRNDKNILREIRRKREKLE
ncbi:unnamed protein product, partial [Mesorhabditis belari]